MFSSSTVSRRSLLRGAALGAGAIAVPGLLAACGGSSGGSGGKTVTFGSNGSDPIPKKAYANVMKAYEKKSGKTVKVNTTDHTTFQTNITRYLKGSPDEVFTWFAGNRMKFFAAQGLAADISDAWKGFNGFSDAMKKASTADDGKQYFVPIYNYPWAVFYRKSLWSQKGYAVPKTFDDLTKLAKKMKADGIIPFSFADKEGWPAMGTFDQLNMRTNGYDFHINLLAGKESWTDPKVKTVFDTWKGLLEYHQPGAAGRTWQEAATALQQRKTGMMLIGSGQVAQQFTGSDLDDVDFFPYPEIDAQYGQDAVEAPIDGFMVSAKARDLDAAKDLIKFLGTPEAENAYQSVDGGNIPTNQKADFSKFTAFQTKSQQFIAGAKQISQFLDRDTRPDFSSPVVIPAFQSFINNPADASSILSNMQKQAKSIFASN
jgi:multiple sugar transport system substrate-binding protein